VLSDHLPHYKELAVAMTLSRMICSLDATRSGWIQHETRIQAVLYDHYGNTDIEDKTLETPLLPYPSSLTQRDYY